MRVLLPNDLEEMKCMVRFRSSPRSFRARRRGRRWSGRGDRRRPGCSLPSSSASTGSSPARLAWRGGVENQGEALGLLGTAPGGFNRQRRARPGLGFQLLQEILGKRKNYGS
jgi:hypothetical protein